MSKHRPSRKDILIQEHEILISCMDLVSRWYIMRGGGLFVQIDDRDENTFALMPEYENSSKEKTVFKTEEM